MTDQELNNEIDNLKGRIIRQEVIVDEIRKQFDSFKIELKLKIDKLSEQFETKSEMIIKEINRQVEYLREENSNKFNQIEKEINEKSNKWVEKVLIALSGLILLGFLTLVFYKIGWQK